MLLSDILFACYALLFVLASIMVIGSNNPIHSVLFLVLTFFVGSNLLLLLEAEFVAMMFLIIYVGAIAVLFLFVVMMLNVRLVVSNFNLLRYLPVAGVLSLIFIAQVGSLIIDLHGTKLALGNVIPAVQLVVENGLLWTNWFDFAIFESQIQVIGLMLYLYAWDVFIVCGIILFLAMVGAIMLTLGGRSTMSNLVQNQVTHISRLTKHG